MKQREVTDLFLLESCPRHQWHCPAAKEEEKTPSNLKTGAAGKEVRGADAWGFHHGQYVQVLSQVSCRSQ